MGAPCCNNCVKPWVEVESSGGAASSCESGESDADTREASGASSAGHTPDAQDAESPCDLGTFAILTCCYYWYRSQGSPTFTPAPFVLSLNDLWGVAFVAAFLVTWRRSYLVYAVNPFRNLILAGLQLSIPELAKRGFFPEYARNILSAALQLASVLLIVWLLSPKPIGRHNEWFAGPLPFIKPDSPMHAGLSRVFTALLIVTGVWLLGCAFWMHTEQLGRVFTTIHLLQITLSVILGVSEEVTWREAYQDDTNNLLQAFTWGVNHIVVGEGMDNPWLYGFLCAIYSLILGTVQHRWARYFNHAAIEYTVINNLIKPQGNPVWQELPARLLLVAQR